MKTLLILSLSLFLALSSFGQQSKEILWASAGNGEVITNLSVYPNPSSNGVFSVSFNTEGSGSISVRVYSLIGREVFHDQINAADGVYRESINVSSLPKGIYILEVSSGDQKQTRRLSFI